MSNNTDAGKQIDVAQMERPNGDVLQVSKAVVSDTEAPPQEYVESPQEYAGQKGLFLAGGITGCPDWQSKVRPMLKHWDLLNPRRKNFPIEDPSAAEQQITWEYNHLRKAKAILFWFPCETLCPIVLYELGAWAMTAKPIFVGTHPEYKRRQDVVIQLWLQRPGILIVHSLEELAAQASTSGLWI